ncbi:MAG: hypothetical protein L0H31_15165 [Nocardioidaceae bacterium]|nr:hypothetical protein [Nocardioidaceae bacterium]
MRLRRLAAAAAGLLVLAPALAACGDDSGDIKTGDVIPARTDAQFVEGTASTLALPIGRLEIFMGKPTTKLDSTDTRQREALEAPAGATFIPITWQYDARTFGDFSAYVGKEVSPTVDLVSSEATYRLPPPEPVGEGSKSFYVPVDGTGEDPQLRVDYDGVTQTVDLLTGKRDEGAAAPLYDVKPTSKTRPCTAGADFHDNAGRSDYKCKVSKPLRLPYADGKWAKKGHGFVAMTVSTSVLRLDILGTDLRSGATYLATGVDSVFRYGGKKPLLVDRVTAGLCPDDTTGGCTGRYHVVFDATGKAAKRLKIDQAFQLELVNKYGAFDRGKRMKLKVTTGLRVG